MPFVLGVPVLVLPVVAAVRPWPLCEAVSARPFRADFCADALSRHTVNAFPAILSHDL